MIEHEFLFLGLLASGPKHGYDIKRQIESEIIPATGIRIKSIYYPLQKMQEERLIEMEVGREGKFPQKQIYRITEKGLKKFDQLMQQSFIEVERPYFQIDLSLYFLPLMDQAIAKKKLKTRLAILKRIRKDLLKLQQKSTHPKPVKLILNHDIDMVEAEIGSIHKTINQL